MSNGDVKKLLKDLQEPNNYFCKFEAAYISIIASLLHSSQTLTYMCWEG